MITVKDVVELPESYETDREDIVYSKEDIDNLPVKIRLDVEKLKDTITENYGWFRIDRKEKGIEGIARAIADNIENIIKEE